MYINKITVLSVHCIEKFQVFQIFVSYTIEMLIRALSQVLPSCLFVRASLPSEDVFLYASHGKTAVHRLQSKISSVKYMRDAVISYLELSYAFWRYSKINFARLQAAALDVFLCDFIRSSPENGCTGFDENILFDLRIRGKVIS